MSGRYGCDTCGHGVEWHTDKTSTGPFRARCYAPNCSCKDSKYKTKREVVMVKR